MVKKKKKEESTASNTTVLDLTEKQKRLDALAAKINSKFQKSMVGRLSTPEVEHQIHIEYIPSASPEFNAAVGGGFPKGKITIVSGMADSGKTSFLLNTIGERMKDNPEFTCVWLESESSLNLDYMLNTFHIDPERFYYIPMVREQGAEEALDQMQELIATGAVDMCVVNTLKALIPLSEIRKKMNELSVSEQARMNGRLISKVIPLITETNTCLVLIQQKTTQIGTYSMGDNTTLAGGLRIRYQAMLIVDLKRGFVKAEDPIDPEEGVKIICKVVKNHCVPDRFPYVKFEYYAIYGEGVETILSTLNRALEQGVLRRAGSHIYWDNPENEDEPLYHWKSRNDFRIFMKENPDVLQTLLNTMDYHPDTLSDEEVKEIQAQEREEAAAAGVDLPEVPEEELEREDE